MFAYGKNCLNHSPTLVAPRLLLPTNLMPIDSSAWSTPMIHNPYATDQLVSVVLYFVFFIESMYATLEGSLRVVLAKSSIPVSAADPPVITMPAGRRLFLPSFFRWASMMSKMSERRALMISFTFLTLVSPTSLTSVNDFVHFLFRVNVQVYTFFYFFRLFKGNFKSKRDIICNFHTTNRVYFE